MKGKNTYCGGGLQIDRPELKVLNGQWISKEDEVWFSVVSQMASISLG
jgi:hypothetical protein